MIQVFLSWIGWEYLHIGNPLPLLFLPFMLLPLMLKSFKAFDHPAIASFPEDWVSRWVERGWRWSSALLIASTCLALSQPYLTQQQVEKVGNGAHLMIVLDRSASMNDEFGQKMDGKAVTKFEAARQVLKNMITQGKNDLIGLVTFSTSPIFVSPLSRDQDYLLAALDATEAGGMGFTAVARGLGMALDYFEGKPQTGSRAILLVSDGGAHLDGKTQDVLRAMFVRQNASLYWVYLRSKNGTSLKNVPSEEEGVDAYPEYALHDYFQQLNVPYHVYEAENEKEVAQAIQDISQLKNKPTRYLEPVSKQDIAWIFYLMAWFSCAILFLLQCMEIQQWRSQ